MKKLMFAAVVAAMAMGAQAMEASWDCIYFFNADRYGDYPMAIENLSQYRLYLLYGNDFNQAKTYVSGKSISTVANNALASATSITRGGIWDDEQYELDADDISDIMSGKKEGYLNDIGDITKAILVAYYGSGEGSGYTPLAYNVIGADSDSFADHGGLWFDDSCCDNTGWLTYSVPEPTSALLMLLGMAGLALKRKVA